MKTKKSILALFLLLSALTVPAVSFSPQDRTAPGSSLEIAGDKFLLTELYFGRSKPDGSSVTDGEWKDFLDKEVTVRFPDGFTVLDGLGQYRDKNGAIVHERSKVLVILYPRKSRKAATEKIEAIRSAYMKGFNQESVLRMDLAVRVWF